MKNPLFNAAKSQPEAEALILNSIAKSVTVCCFCLIVHNFLDRVVWSDS